MSFDDWVQLARTDPEAFEARRLAHIEAVIARAPADKQRRLRGLQWQIDQARRRAPTPLSACLRISRMMWESILARDGLLDRLEQFSGRRPPAPPPPLARVLPLRAPRGSKAPRPRH
ncbi:DUF3135 domain-containing protein [Alkalilimnicola sp. S0819]|uniref:DUF3135 domain-containing protein n=1 Tax=Alkalilimnicola sp. S0819 TaxID=2613922 RepID=UPI00186A7E85|nr:DUF3135 domain-containing protein [Alkalilimnicola sp. S0819]